MHLVYPHSVIPKTMDLPEVYASTEIKTRLIQGHPWVYRNQIKGGERLRSGTWVRLRCGPFQAIGLWDADSPIAVRLFTRYVAPNADWVSERVWEAWEARASIRAGMTNAYRWIYGEGDWLPGIVVDRYGDYAVIQTYAASVATLIPLIVPALRACDPDLRGIVVRETATEHQAPQTAGFDATGATSKISHPSLQKLWGELPPNDLVVEEHGLFLYTDLYRGQKTGLFLDQRENRHTVETLAGGLRVLNCFAYTGAFSLYALRGDAASVISADSGHGLADAAAANVALNQFDPARHSFVTSDCFALLDGYAKAGQRFDMVILDPPSFARAKANAYSAIRAYTRLNTLALRCIEPGGLLVSSSCTSQVSPEQFRTMLADAAARARRRVQIIHDAGQASDHPVPAGFLEGRYLKFMIARVLPVV
ncbi:MAG: class I SAM-dependent rRNA methyltransferase [Chloroflexales bacterium]|nr:class I SAM-dependent rRNA methyltransferase [Chloroflexales bacterium]